MGAEVIQRWFTCGYGSGLIPDERGDVVTYDDHAAALSAERAKVRELVEALEPINDYFRKEHWPNHPLRMKIEALIEKYKDEPNES